MPDFDEEEYRRDARILNPNISTDEDGNYEPLHHYSMPYAFFVLVRVVLGIALVICLPFLFISFAESIKGYLILLSLFVLMTAVSRMFTRTY